jgi:hypothetical protein
MDGVSPIEGGHKPDVLLRKDVLKTFVHIDRMKIVSQNHCLGHGILTNASSVRIYWKNPIHASSVISDFCIRNIWLPTSKRSMNVHTSVKFVKKNS